MNIANLYRKLKQILNDSNIALVNKGLNAVNNLYEIPSEIANIESINKLPYVLGKKILEITADDLTGVTSINTQFDYCPSLTSITIPDSVEKIARFAFSGCTSLTDIYLKPTTPPALGGTDVILTTTTIHIPIGSGDAYRNATNWSYHSARIVEDIVV